MSQSRVVFQNQWYVSLLLCSNEYRLLVVVVVLEEINIPTVVARFLLGKFIIVMPESSPWGITLNLVQHKLTKNAPSFKYRSIKLYWVQMEYCEYRLKNFGTCLLGCSRRLNRRARRSDGGERVKSYAGKTRGKKRIEGRQVFLIRFLFSVLVDFSARALLSKRLEHLFTTAIGWFSNRTGTSVDDRRARGKDLNTTSGAQFAALPLVNPVVWFERAVVNWRSRSVAKSA